MKFDILTGGPVFLGQEFPSESAAKKYVERHAPMKSGWTGEWSSLPSGALIYRRYNSKGNHVGASYNITLRKAQPLRKVWA